MIDRVTDALERAIANRVGTHGRPKATGNHTRVGDERTSKCRRLIAFGWCDWDARGQAKHFGAIGTELATVFSGFADIG